MGIGTSINFRYYPNLIYHFVLNYLQAAWGGGLLMSRKHRHPRFSGVER